MKRKNNSRNRPVRERLRAVRIAPELDDFIRNMQTEYKKHTGLKNIHYTDCSLKVKELAEETLRKKKKKREFELKFDSII